MTTIPLILATMLVGQSGFAGSPLPIIDAALACAGVTPDDVVYDIGSGDGRVCVFAVKKYGCRAVGIELDANLVDISRQTVVRNGVQNLVTIRHEDALKADLSTATVVFCYHQTDFLELLRLQLERLPSGTRVVFLDYSPDWLELTAVKTLKVGEHTHQIYLWMVGQQTDSPLVAAGKAYPGVRCFEGERDAVLVESAQWCADKLAAAGERGYWRDGHPNWETRYHAIRNEIGMRPVEVSAMSSATSPELTDAIARDMYYDWQRSSGHWRVVSQPHKRYGEGVARSRTNRWFSVVIVAD